MLKLTRPAPQFSKEAMQAATGKDWNAWVAVIAGNARKKDTIASIMERLTSEHNLSPAWARTIAAYYVMERR
jgi:hypothetical protein